MAKTLATKLKQLSGRAWPVVLVLQVLVVPHKAFRKIRERGYILLAILVYAISAALASYTIYSQPASYLPWAMLFHPVQSFAQSTFSDYPNWYYSFPILSIAAIVLIDMLALAIVAMCTRVAGQALLGLEIRARNLVAALYLLIGVISLLAWPFFLLNSLSQLFESPNTSSTGLLISVLLWIAFTIYYIIALVVICEISTLKALGLCSLTLLFFPIWVIASAIHSTHFLVPKLGKDRHPPALSGILLKPSETFQHLESSPPMWKLLTIYLGISMLIIVTARIAIDRDLARSSDDLFPLLFLAMIPFFKAHLVLFNFALDFLFITPTPSSSDFVIFQNALYNHVLIYPYLVLAPAALLVLFAAAVHLTITRIWDTHNGSFRTLLAAFLYIVNAASIYIVIPGVVFFEWLIFKEDFFNQSNAFSQLTIVYFVWLYWTLFLWSVLMHIIAIRQVYHFPGERAVGAWFASIILFIPVSVITIMTRAFEEIRRPFRVRARARELEKLRYEAIEEIRLARSETAMLKIDQLVELYSQAHEISRRARPQVDLFQPFQQLYLTAQEPALDFLLKLARHTDEDVQITASNLLQALLDGAPEQVLSSIYYLMRNETPPELFGRLIEAPDQTRATGLCTRIHALLTKTNEENLAPHLLEMKELLENWRNRQHGEEVYEVYRAFYILSQAKNVVDLELASGELAAALDARDPLLSATAQTLKQLLDISNYLAYYQRAEFENKIPYLAAPIMILVDEMRRLEKSNFPPEVGILRLLIARLQDIIFREFDGLRGRADLRFELRPQRAPFDHEVSLVLYLRNQGSAAAEGLQVSLEAGSNNNFTPSENSTMNVSLLSPKREARLEFNILPTEAGRLRIPFHITYDDLEKKGRNLPYAALVELYEPSAEATPNLPAEDFKNPYITGLPVKDPTMFFGREDIFRFIRDHLQGRHEKNVLVLSAPRRTGKTSILYQLANHLDEKYIPVLLDLQGFASTGTDRFLYWMARLITRAVHERNYALVLPGLETFRDDPFGAFQQTFLPEALKHIGYHHLLLAFDEFEELSARVQDGKVDKDIFPFLRNMMQHTEQLDFLFVGTHKLRLITFEYWSILFNIALFRDIGFMKPEEVAQTIRTPVKGVIFYDDLAIEKINRITAGHPYFVQLLGNKLVDYYQQEGKFYLTLQDVNRVLEEVIVGGALHFDYLWSESTPQEQLTLAAMTRIISREGGVASVADILALLERFEVKFSQQQLLAAARTLVTRDLVITDSDFSHFEFKIDLMRLWLDRYQRFGIVVEVYRDQRRLSGQTTNIEMGGNS